jgi:hypothetical protein
MVEVVANMHMHTPYSDGNGTHEQIAEAAARAKLDVVIVTDHNVYVRGKEGYCNGTLMLIGEEVHDCRRRPQANHCLVFDANDEMSVFAKNPQTLIDETNARGGATFFAHIVEYPSHIGIEDEAYSWLEWDTRDFTGIEIWNYMTEFKSRLWNWLITPLWAFFPSLCIKGPFKASLQKWDELTAKGKRVVAIGNSDAHAFLFHVGPITRVVFPYEYLFRCVNTHVLIDAPFRRDLVTDKSMFFAALRAGRCFIGYDLIESTRGFRFTARCGANSATMGDEIKRVAAVRFEVICPAPASIRLVCNGRTVASGNGEKLVATAIEPGAYRVEVYRNFRGLNRGWIFSNPIYVR